MTLQRVAVVGAGFMGSGIAETVARAGLDVVVHDPEAAALGRSREGIAASYARAVQKGRLEETAAEAALGRVTWAPDLAAVRDADIVIEAVFEDPEVKGSLFAELDALVRPDTILASNTSSIPIAQLAARTTRPQRVLGLHFFSPVPVMTLAEVVVALETDPAVADATEAFAQQIGKATIRTKDRAGFIVNMLLIPYLTAAVRMLEDGFASRDDIDDGMRRGAGHPMGPLQLCDLIGLDVVSAICDSLYDEFKRPDLAPPPLLRRMVVSGRLGRKSGRGFYDYD